jgi:hypothetical protein
MPALAVAALAGGCGDSSLSDPALRARATQICSAATKQSDRIGTPTSPSAGAAFLRKATRVFRPELKALRGLRPSKDAASTYRTALNAFAQKLDALDTTARALASGGDPVIAIKGLQTRLTPLLAQEDGAWRALAITACVNR